MNTSSYLKVFAAKFLENEKKSISLHLQKHNAELNNDNKAIKLINEQINFSKREWGYIEAAIVTEYRELNPNGINIDKLYNNSKAFSDWCRFIIEEGNELFVCDKEGTLINTVSIVVTSTFSKDITKYFGYTLETYKSLYDTATRNNNDSFYLKTSKDKNGNDKVSIYLFDHFEVTHLFKDPLEVLAECELQAENRELKHFKYATEQLT